MQRQSARRSEALPYTPQGKAMSQGLLSHPPSESIPRGFLVPNHELEGNMGHLGEF